NGLIDARHHLYWSEQADWTGTPSDAFESSPRQGYRPPAVVKGASDQESNSSSASVPSPANTRR
ncbi:hypothetical protein AB0J01_04825, partial [Streptomyces sp. NPDC050204]